jgi:hypothetical protein
MTLPTIEIIANGVAGERPASSASLNGAAGNELLLERQRHLGQRGDA